MPLAVTVAPEVVTFYEELLKEGELSTEETQLLETILGREKNWKKFKSGVHARSLTDKERQDIKAEREKQEAEYTKKVGDLDSLRETLSTGTDLSKKQIETLQGQIRVKEDQIHKVIQKIKEFADGDEVLKILGLDANSPYVEPKKEEPKKEASSFTKEDVLVEMRKALSTDAQFLAKLPFDLMKLSREYFSLTGKELDTDDFLAKIVASGTGNYDEVYLKEYDIPNLRAKKQEETLTARLEKEIREKLDKEYASRLLPQEQRSVKESEFYQAVDSTRPKEDAGRNQGNPLGIDNFAATVSAAEKDFNIRREKKESVAA